MKNLKKIIIYTLLISFGAFVGSYVTWINSYLDTSNTTQAKIKLEEILKYSNTAISKENYRCEGEVKDSVGEVVGSILEWNYSYKRNMLSYGCYEETCYLSVTNCKPWHDQECGSRILKYEIDKNENIKEETFACLDVP